MKTGDHYRTTGIEVMDIIEQFELDFSLGNSLKYILRAPHKGTEEEDLFKALNYLHRKLYGTWFVCTQ